MLCKNEVVSLSEYCLFDDDPRQINSRRNGPDTNRIFTKASGHSSTLQAG